MLREQRKLTEADCAIRAPGNAGGPGRPKGSQNRFTTLKAEFVRVYENEGGKGPGGVLVLSHKGELLGRIVTGERIANVGWGNDGSVLYLTSDMYLCRI